MQDHGTAGQRSFSQLAGEKTGEPVQLRSRHDSACAQVEKVDDRFIRRAPTPAAKGSQGISHPRKHDLREALIKLNCAEGPRGQNLILLLVDKVPGRAVKVLARKNDYSRIALPKRQHAQNLNMRAGLQGFDQCSTPFFGRAGGQHQLFPVYRLVGAQLGAEQREGCCQRRCLSVANRRLSGRHKCVIVLALDFQHEGKAPPIKFQRNLQKLCVQLGVDKPQSRLLNTIEEERV